MRTYLGDSHDEESSLMMSEMGEGVLLYTIWNEVSWARASSSSSSVAPRLTYWNTLPPPHFCPVTFSLAEGKRSRSRSANKSCDIFLFFFLFVITRGRVRRHTSHWKWFGPVPFSGERDELLMDIVIVGDGVMDWVAGSLVSALNVRSFVAVKGSFKFLMFKILNSW